MTTTTARKTKYGTFTTELPDGVIPKFAIGQRVRGYTQTRGFFRDRIAEYYVPNDSTYIMYELVKGGIFGVSELEAE